MSVNQDRRYNRSSLFEFLQHDGMLSGDSNENIQHTILNIKKEIARNYPEIQYCLQLRDYFS